MAAAQDLNGMFQRVMREIDLERLVPGACICVHLTGSEGGVWTLDTNTNARIQRGDTGQPDCRITCSPPDLLGLLKGGLSPQRVFMDGRLQVEGDVGLLLRLQRAIVSLELEGERA